MTIACISNASGLKQIALTPHHGQTPAAKGAPGGEPFRSLLGSAISTAAGTAGTETAARVKGHGFLALAAGVLRPETAAAATTAALHPPAPSSSILSPSNLIPH